MKKDLATLIDKTVELRHEKLFLKALYTITDQDSVGQDYKEMLKDYVTDVNFHMKKAKLPENMAKAEALFNTYYDRLRRQCLAKYKNSR